VTLLDGPLSGASVRVQSAEPGQTINLGAADWPAGIYVVAPKRRGYNAAAIAVWTPADDLL
jgi:hypothetical protein